MDQESMPSQEQAEANSNTLKHTVPTESQSRDSDSQYTDIDDDEDDTNHPQPDSSQTNEQKPSNDEDQSKSTKPAKTQKQRKDPANIPRKGYFFEHDDREDEKDQTKQENPTEPVKNPQPRQDRPKPQNQRKPIGKKAAQTRQTRHNSNQNENLEREEESKDRWAHDRFDLTQQQPKSKTELVKRYGYDIREEKDVDLVKELPATNNVPKPERKTSEPAESVKSSTSSAPRKNQVNNRKMRPNPQNENVNRTRNKVRSKTGQKHQNQDEYEDFSDEEDKNAEKITQNRREILKNGDDEDEDDFGERLANLRRRKPRSAPTNAPKSKQTTVFDDYQLNHAQHNRSSNNNEKQPKKYSNEFVKPTRSFPSKNQARPTQDQEEPRQYINKSKSNLDSLNQGQQEVPKRYSSMRSQQQGQQRPITSSQSINSNISNQAQQLPHQQAQTQYQHVQHQNQQYLYENGPQPQHHQQNWGYSQQQHHYQQQVNMGPPPGLSVPHNHQSVNNRQYYYMPQNDYLAAQEYAVAMAAAASLMSNQMYYPNGNGQNSAQTPSPTLSPLNTNQMSPSTNVLAYGQHQHASANNNRLSKAIPIVNPQRFDRPRN